MPELLTLDYGYDDEANIKREANIEIYENSIILKTRHNKINGGYSIALKKIIYSAA
jgi:hypothetical protein